MPRLSVNLSDDAYHEIEELAAEKGKPITHVVRDALALEKWFEDTRKEGGRVIVERGGTAREVIPR